LPYQQAQQGVGDPWTHESLPDLVVESFDDKQVQTIVGQLVHHYRVDVAFVAFESQSCLKLRARHGTSLRQLPLGSIARHKILRNLPIIIGDVAKMPEFDDDEAVAGPPRLRFFAGAPLMTTECTCVGNLVIMDQRPRENFGLQDCAQLVEAASVIVRAYRSAAESPELWGMSLPSTAVLPSCTTSPSVVCSPGASTPLHTRLVAEALEHVRQDAVISGAVAEVVQFYEVSVAFLALESPSCLALRAQHGLSRETLPLSSIARHSVLRDLPIIIEDAWNDDDWKQDDLVRGPPALRFYAGAPIMVSPDHCAGSLVIMDERPRKDFKLGDCDVLVNAAKTIADVCVALQERAVQPSPPGGLAGLPQPLTAGSLETVHSHGNSVGSLPSEAEDEA